MDPTDARPIFAFQLMAGRSGTGLLFWNIILVTGSIT